jgi:hypothetical protein
VTITGVGASLRQSSDNAADEVARLVAHLGGVPSVGGGEVTAVPGMPKDGRLVPFPGEHIESSPAKATLDRLFAGLANSPLVGDVAWLEN